MALWILVLLACEAPENGGTDTADSGSWVDTGLGEVEARYFQLDYQGAPLVQATLNQQPTEEGGRRIWGTTWYDYTLSTEYVSTLTEEFVLDADDLLVSADLHVVTNLGTAVYEDRATLENGVLRITRPAGSLSWEFEASHPIVLCNLTSDGFFGFNQMTPAAAQTGIYTTRVSDAVSLVSHEYIDVFDLNGGDSRVYSLGRDTIRAKEDGSLGRILIGDTGNLALKPVDGPIVLDPVFVAHGEEDVGFPDCGLSGVEESFSVTSSDGFTLEGTAHWPDGWEAEGRAITFNAGTGGSDRFMRAGGVSRWECLAKPFLDAGIAVIRYDDRAHGQSDGVAADLSFEARDLDAMAVAQWSAAQAGVEHLYLLGHSEGGTHVSAVATEMDIAGLVLLAVIGDETGLELWIEQGETYLREHGFDEGYIGDFTDARLETAEDILAGTYTEEFLGNLPTAGWRGFFEAQGAELAVAANTPAFIAQGDLDWQVVEQNGLSLHDALEAAGIDSTYFGVSPSGHFLNRAPEGFPMSGDEYWLPLNWDSEMTTAAVDWVLLH